MYYDYIYIISFFPGPLEGEQYGRYSKSFVNITYQLTFLDQYSYLAANNKSVLFIVRQGGANVAASAKVQQLLDNNPNPERIHTKLLVCDNWGMLPGALWDGYRYLRDNDITANYVMAICDDWLFNHWPYREYMIESGEADCVGHFSTMALCGPHAKQYRRWCQLGYKDDPLSMNSDKKIRLYCNQIGTDQSIAELQRGRRWTDGGGYFLSFDTLIKMEEAMAPHRFTLAPYDSNSWSWTLPSIDRLKHDPLNKDFIFGEHGIFFGEIGMPTHMWLKGFKCKAFTAFGYESSSGQWVDPTQCSDISFMVGDYDNIPGPVGWGKNLHKFFPNDDTRSHTIDWPWRKDFP